MEYPSIIWLAWNAASVFYIENENKMEKDSACWRWALYQFKKGENLRLELAKTINRERILTNRNILEPFFIIELVHSGEVVSFYDYLFIDDGNNIKGIEYKFSRRDTTWIHNEAFTINWFRKKESVIDKRKFNQFFNNVKKKKCRGDAFLYYDLYVTKFTPDSIESYLMQCGDDYTCIDEFFKIADIERYN